MTTFRHSWLFFCFRIFSERNHKIFRRTDGRKLFGRRSDGRTADGRTDGKFSDGRTDGNFSDGRTPQRTDGRTNKKKRKMQSVSQTIDLVVTIPNLAESSKSELSSVTFDHFKVYKKRAKCQKSQLCRTPISPDGRSKYLSNLTVKLGGAPALLDTPLGSAFGDTGSGQK